MLLYVSEQEQMAANQSINVDQTVDRDTTGTTGSVKFTITTFSVYAFTAATSLFCVHVGHQQRCALRNQEAANFSTEFGTDSSGFPLVLISP